MIKYNKNFEATLHQVILFFYQIVFSYILVLCGIILSFIRDKIIICFSSRARCSVNNHTSSRCYSRQSPSREIPSRYAIRLVKTWPCTNFDHKARSLARSFTNPVYRLLLGVARNIDNSSPADRVEKPSLVICTPPGEMINGASLWASRPGYRYVRDTRSP